MYYKSMKFDLEHDWQGNMSTPRKNLGVKTKLNLFIILAFIWSFVGLIGHDPWAPQESNTISQIVSIVQESDFVVPKAASNDFIQNQPLYSLVAASSIKVFSPFLAHHDAARLTNLIWISLTLLIIGMTTRELWGLGFGRSAGLIFIASIGLILNVHTLTPEIGAMPGYALSLYALCLYIRRPFRASFLLGAGLIMLFMSGGFIPLLSIIVTSIFLFIFKDWQNKRYLTFLALSFMLSFAFIFPWLILFRKFHLDEFILWYQKDIFSSKTAFLYTLEGIAWFTWPALPLVAWVLIKNFKKILSEKKFVLLLGFAFIYYVLISFSPRQDQINLIPLLIPFSILAVGAIDNLNRGMSSSLNWLSVFIFSFFALLIWIGWSVSLLSFPENLYERLYDASGNYDFNFSFFKFLVAFLITGYWIFSIVSSKITNRSMVTNWAIGITMIWVTFICLWGDAINNRKSYKGVFEELKIHVTQSSSCIYSQNLTNSQIDMFHYYAKIKLKKTIDNKLDCQLALVSLKSGSETPSELKEWREIWTGKRVKDKNYFILLGKN